MRLTVRDPHTVVPLPRTLMAACVFALGFLSLASAQFPTTRVPATTLRMPSEGTTWGYKTSPAFGGLYFEQPVQVVSAPPDSQRAFIVERPGRVSVVRDTANPARETFLDLTGRTETANGGLLSLAFHP